MSKQNYVVVQGEPQPCPRCGETLQIREHKEITAKQLSKPFYYSRWFCCMNPSCQTTLVMRDRYKVAGAPAPDARRNKPVISDDPSAPW